ncbi:MAG: cytochrome c biogenesis protein CcsA [Dehalococcoidia bacterium]|nr:cytochrome c biogenesis protein CcsA [Dehalococcoidia bacterium]
MSFAGNAVIILAFLITIYSIASALLDSRDNKYSFPPLARWGVFAAAGLLTLAVVLLLTAFLTHDFSLLYVYNYSATDTPFAYLISGLWAGNAGSLLFWCWLIAVSGAVLLWRSNKSNRPLMPVALSVILFSELLFLIILIFIESPFAGLSPVPADGLGLRPVLQTPLMISHPPTLLAGYALTTVPFALALAALYNRTVDETWVLTARRWAVAAWLLLGVGNILGMWWAYAELGWGGYWAWDPVENAGLMPWLTLTAFLHSSMLYVRRGQLKGVTTLFALVSLVLTIFGAFLTRSNVPGSVHTFGSTGMTPVFTVFLLTLVVGSVWLFISRRDDLKSNPGDERIVSATSTFSVANGLIAASVIIIFIGTVLPFFIRTSPGTDFFNLTQLPLFLALILLAGIAMFVGWKQPDPNKLVRQLLWPVAGGAIAVVISFAVGGTSWHALLAVFIVGAAITATLVKWAMDVAARARGKQENLLTAFCRLFVIQRGRYGGYIVHIGIFLMALGIIFSSAYRSEISSVMAKGDSVELRGYVFQYNGYEISPMQHKGDGVVWLTFTADVSVSRDGEVVAVLHPHRTLQYVISEGTVTGIYLVNNEVAIEAGLIRDLYLIFVDYDTTAHETTQTVLLTIIVEPMVSWIWIGGGVLLLGGLLSFSAALRKPGEE